MHVIFIAMGMHTNLWMANCNFQLHIFEATVHKELKLGLHTFQSTYITMVESLNGNNNEIPSFHGILHNPSCGN